MLGQAEPLEQLVRATAYDGPRQVIEPADELEVRAGAEEPVDRGGLSREPDAAAHRRRVGDDVQAVDARGAGRRLGECGEDADRGGLARAVVAEQPEDRAGRHVEIEVAQRPQIAVALAQLLGDDRSGSG